jgi:GNAT superfamily N-acetyltransferase
MSAPPALRAGRDADAEGFIALIGACWAEYPGNILDVDGEVPELRALASYYGGQGGALWVAERDGRIAGMVGTRPLGDGAWELCKMYTDAGLRGGGLAQALIGAAEDFARARGATRMRLWSDTRFDRAHRFYEKQSYVRAGPLKVHNDLSNSIEFEYAKPLAGVVVERLDAAAAASAEARLVAILQDCVAAGASVSFLPPVAREAAAGFWRRKASEVAQGKRVLLTGWLDGVLAGTVMLDLDMPANQPHRADLQKLLVHPAARRRGLARRLMAAAEAAARAERRNLLVLDTQDGSEAEPLYRASGWTEVGRIPDFSLNAAGGLDATILFWKKM